MNPQLSRRVALIMMSDAVRALDVDRHIAFVTEVSRAESFEDLPIWVSDIIIEGEKQRTAALAAG